MPAFASGSLHDPIDYPTVREKPLEPPPELQKLSNEGSIHSLRYPDGHIGWLITSHSLCRSVLADPHFSSRSELRRPAVSEGGVDALWGHKAPPGLFIIMDPPEHTRFRRLLAGQFTARKMRDLEPHVEDLVKHHLDTIAQAVPPVDLVDNFALPVPLYAICELMGVPASDRDEFRKHVDTVQSLTSTEAEGAAALDALTSYLRGLITGKQKHPETDLLSYLIQTEEVSIDELAGVGVLLVGAGHETTASMLSLSILTLLTYPDQLNLLMTDLDLIENAVEELLRYLTIFQFGITRTALEDTCLDGVPIQKGQCITLSLPAANWDRKKFHEPDRFDIGSNPRGHLAFARGIHQCLGQQMARMELKVAIGELFLRFPSLALAKPMSCIPMRSESVGYGVRELPVSW